ncbi:MAG: hypothetical protein R6W70_04830 [bacterium]
MNRVVLLSFSGMMIFAVFLIFFMSVSENSFMNFSFLLGMLLLFVMWSVFVILLFFMGKPAVLGDTIGSYEMVTVAGQGRFPRKWLSCSLVLKNSYIILCVFGREKSRLSVADIKNVVLSEGVLSVISDNLRYELHSGVDAGEEKKRLFEKIMEGNNEGQNHISE